MMCAILLAPVMKMNAEHISHEKSAKLAEALLGSCANNHDEDINAVLNHI